MTVRPSGTITFLFTDVEGSTHLWEKHPRLMETALELHDEILRSAIDTHGGYVFSTAGDAFSAAFTSADEALSAAIATQRDLDTAPWPDGVALRVRMGLHTGESQERGGDYFGSTLNRAARVMSAGHGGQVLLSQSTAGLITDSGLIDLGERRLKDLSATTRLYQVDADGLQTDFPPLRTVDGVPGNLTSQTTSFVGRDSEIRELRDLVSSHRLVTLTGVGGVGKTRLALQVAAESSDDFDDGVWLVELAGIGDPAAVPDAVAAVLGITARSGSTAAGGIAEVLADRQMLLLLDNCEHVLNAVADLVDAVAEGTEAVKVLATSRESLRVNGERVWSVPSLDVDAGRDSVAVELFIDRARASITDFGIGDEEQAGAVIEICQRLDGIALAIELAAARMVSMSAQDVRDRLDDRFRLLSGSRRGLERHQTLRHAIGWSYDLLDDAERRLLNRCAVFADGFDLAAATHMATDFADEYEVVDLLDSLVRKSLVTTKRAQGHVRYGLLETIRQFADEQLANTEAITDVRDQHAQYFADQAIAQWAVWNSPQQRAALDWVDAEFANLRTAFRWAADSNDLDTAAAIAAHTTVMNWLLAQYQSIAWIEEILPAATTADLAQLPRLHTAAAWCAMTGRPEEAVEHAETAVNMLDTAGYDPFEPLLTNLMAETARHQVLVISTNRSSAPLNGSVGNGLTFAEADARLTTALHRGVPSQIAFAMVVAAQASANESPDRALNLARQALDYCDEHRLLFVAGAAARTTADLEASHGSMERALDLLERALDMFQTSGHQGASNVAPANIAVLFTNLGQPEVAATVYGISRKGTGNTAIGLSEALQQLKDELGETAFSEFIDHGHSMSVSDAIDYTRQRLREAREQVQATSS